MSTSKITGIVVKIIDYQVYDQILTIFSAHEIITFLALGVRKINSKNRVALQLGNIVEVEIFRARLHHKLSKLKRANLLKQVPIQRGNTAQYLIKLIAILQQLTKPSAKLLSAYLAVFNDWGLKYNAHIQTYLYFAILDALGRYPILNQCVECGRKYNIAGFEFYVGGFTCQAHTKKPQSLAFLKAISALGQNWNAYKNTNVSVNEVILNLLKHELENFYLIKST